MLTTTTVRGFDSRDNYDTVRPESGSSGSGRVDAIVSAWERMPTQKPGNTRELALPEEQLALARAAASTGKTRHPGVTEGRPRFITSIAPSMKGILMAYWSGRKTAEAISDVLLGDYNPDGKLPFSYPRSMGEMVLYDRKPTEDVREIFNSDMNMKGYDPCSFGWG